jgi:hypothetical protein
LSELRNVWASLLGSGPLKPLSPTARVFFAVMAVSLTVLAAGVFLYDLVASGSSTGALIFIVLPFYVALTYGTIFAVDRLVRFTRREAR